MRKFARNENGATAVLFGLSLVPLIIAIGAAVDYANAAKENALLTRAADAAVLFAVTEARDRIAEGDASWQEKAKTVALGAFAANAQGASNTARKATVSFSQTATGVSVTVDAASKVSTVFMRLMGKTSVPVAQAATATTQTARYIDIHLVVDNSPSMGIGATTTDQALIYNKVGCQVACHYKQSLTDVPSLAAARSTGAVLRVDVVKSALVNALSNIQADGRTRVAVHLLGNSLTTTFPLSADIAGAIKAVNAIELTNKAMDGGTNISNTLDQLNKKLARAGTGNSQSSPYGVVMLATDAVEDNTMVYLTSENTTIWTLDQNVTVTTPSMQDEGSTRFQTFDPAKCAPIKQKDYAMYTLEVAYLIPKPVPPIYNGRLNFIENALLPKRIPAAMSQCASSPGNYLHAETPNEINDAMKALFRKIQTPRISK